MPSRPRDAYKKIALPKPTAQPRPQAKPVDEKPRKYTILLSRPDAEKLDQLTAAAYSAAGHRVNQSDLFRAAIAVMTTDERVRDEIIARAGELSDRR